MLYFLLEIIEFSKNIIILQRCLTNLKVNAMTKSEKEQTQIAGASMIGIGVGGSTVSSALAGAGLVGTKAALVAAGTVAPPLLIVAGIITLGIGIFKKCK